MRILTLVVPNNDEELIILRLRRPEACAKTCPECGTEIPTMDELARDAADVLYGSVCGGFWGAFAKRVVELRP